MDDCEEHFNGFCHMSRSSQKEKGLGNSGWRVDLGEVKEEDGHFQQRN